MGNKLQVIVKITGSCNNDDIAQLEHKRATCGMPNREALKALVPCLKDPENGEAQIDLVADSTAAFESSKRNLLAPIIWGEL